MKQLHAIPLACIFGSIICLIYPDLSAGVESGSSAQVFPISTTFCAAMKEHRVMNSGAPIGCERLRLVRFAYCGFDGRIHRDGEIVVMDAVAENVVRIFDSLRSINFPIAKSVTMDHYGGNDDSSMADNNTSSFNVRLIKGGRSISLHSYGLAIDLNPVQNPFLRRPGKELDISPSAGRKFLDRTRQRAGMAETALLVFACNGFVVWGGSWRDPVDYQHFQVRPELSTELAKASPAAARAIFEAEVKRYNTCCRPGDPPPSESRGGCPIKGDPLPELIRDNPQSNNP